jgi:large conductance mechanosensitive channel
MNFHDLKNLRKTESAKAVGGFFEEFKGFALKGNMIDLAVGIVIGTAFTGVVKALVDHIFMPMLSYVTPTMSYRQWKIDRIEIGEFLAQVINFTVVSFAVFVVVVKLIGLIMRDKQEKKEEAPKEVPADVALLTEIRDLLKSRATSPTSTTATPPPEERPDTLI